MKEKTIAVQFRDPTGNAAIKRADTSFGSEWSTVTFPKPKEVIVPKTETVDPVNGVKEKHQTGIKTLHDIEVKLARIRHQYIDGSESRAILRMQKRQLLLEHRTFDKKRG